MTLEVVKQIEAPAVGRILAKTKTAHQVRVEAFMVAARQLVQDRPRVPTPAVCEMRARLIFEEAMETINALGVQISVVTTDYGQYPNGEVQLFLNVPDKGGSGEGRVINHEFEATAPCNLAAVADGCADVAVVTTGTLSACGIADEMIQEEVDYNNLAKFGEGHTFREDGKIIKPPGHQKPNIREILVLQGAVIPTTK